MKDKQTLIEEIKENLRTGVLTEDDLKPFITPRPLAMPSVSAPIDVTDKPDRLSAVDIMFYISGIVFFSTIMSLIVQSWSDGNALMHILLSAGVGVLLWVLVYYLAKSSSQSDTIHGLSNALLLTGSLLLVVGGYIITNELVGGYDEVNYLPIAVTFAILGALHLGFDRLLKKDLTLLMGILLSVAAFPALLFGILQDADAPADLWSLTLIISMALLAYTTRVVAKINPPRQKIHNSFDSLGAFVALMTMYIASYGEYDVAWLAALIGSVFGIFYLSILSQNKHLLGNASFFLVLTIITISFKYFSDFGATASLIVATCGLLGTAAIASSINKKYFSQSDS